MRLTKIYTKIGDKGSTMLASGKKIAKSHPRIEAYGTVDELNAFCGLLVDKLSHSREANFESLLSSLNKIQHELFDIGGELSTPLEHLDPTRQQVVDAESVHRLEREIDSMNEALPPLKNFVLPGGHELNSLAHIARTVCRRAERVAVSLSEADSIRTEPLIYLNRLSDWFFVAGRFISKQLGAEETLWSQNSRMQQT